MPNQQMQMMPVLTYLDRPEIPETFVDSVEKVTFDQITCRLEFTVNRFDAAVPGAAPTGKKVTACRLIMPLPALLQTAHHLNQVVQALQQQGLIQPVVPQSGGVN